MTDSTNPNPLSRLGEMLDNRFKVIEAELLLLTGTVNLLLQHACASGATHRAELEQQVDEMREILHGLGSLQGSPDVQNQLARLRRMLIDNLPQGPQET